VTRAETLARKLKGGRGEGGGEGEVGGWGGAYCVMSNKDSTPLSFLPTVTL